MARMRSRLETGEALRSWTLPWLEELDTWKRTKLGSGYNHPQTSLVEWQGHPHTIRRSFFFHHYQSHPATIRVEAEMDHLVHRRPSVEPTRGPKDPEAGSCPLQGLSMQKCLLMGIFKILFCQGQTDKILQYDEVTSTNSLPSTSL